MNLFLTGGESSWFGLGPVGLVIILIVVGLVLIAAEVVLTPGFGVAGIAGLVLLVLGCVSAWVSLGLVWGAVTIIIAVIVIILLIVFVSRSRAVRKQFVLDSALGKGGGTESKDLERFVGSTGVTKTDLRPAGIAMVDGTRVDVVSDGDFIDKDERVKIIAVDGPRVVAVKMERDKEKKV